MALARQLSAEGRRWGPAERRSEKAGGTEFEVRWGMPRHFGDRGGKGGGMGSLRGSWKVQGIRGLLCHQVMLVQSHPEASLAQRTFFSIVSFPIPKPPLPPKEKPKQAKEGEIMIGKAGEWLMASSRPKCRHSPELRPIISVWPRCQKG